MTTRYVAFQCPTCKDVLISRARHDFNSCSCGQQGIFVDGESIHDPSLKNTGWYRIGYGNAGVPKGYYVDLPATREEVYQDYNRSKDQWKKIDTSKYPLIDIKSDDNK